MSDIFWKKVLSDLEVSVSRPNFVTWLKPTRFVENRNGLVIIAVPNPYAKNWLEKNIIKELKKVCQEEFEDFEDIKFEISKKEAASAYDELPILKQVEEEEREMEAEEGVPNSFHSRYTFDTFVVGNNNRLAFAAAQVVADKPGEAYNPLFLYGGVGLGKTHLMHAIANQVLQKNPKKKIIYTSCETFTSEFIDALKTNGMTAFKKKYRNVDMFLVDDIQFLSNKEGTQEEFFHTFNMLHQSNRQIVVTSDRVPKEINDLEDRLVSRFGWGMIADIQSPNFENRMAILQSKAQERGAVIPEEALEYIAQTITSNVRELEGSLIKLMAAAEVEGETITREYAKRTLKDLIKTNGSVVTTKQIVAKVADYFNVEINDILGKSRIKELVYPRQIVMFLLRNRLGHTLPQIGDELGGKDHTTVMHSVEKITKLRKVDSNVENDLQAIEKMFS